MILIVASNKDVASLNIRKQIMKNYDFSEESIGFEGNPSYSAEFNSKKVKLVTLNNESVYAQNLPASFSKLGLIVFISRHSSLSGMPTLSVHTPGNLNAAELGGVPQTVSISPAKAMREALNSMMKFKTENILQYEVSYEGTHHGPSLNVPTMFAELGSSIEQWNDQKAAEAVAHAAIEAVSKFKSSPPTKITLGIGGPHYNAKFTRIAFERDVSFGHMIPKHVVPTLTIDVLQQCVRKTLEDVDYVTLDWKGIRGEDKPKVARMLDELSLPFEKV